MYNEQTFTPVDSNQLPLSEAPMHVEGAISSTDETIGVGNYAFNQETIRRELALMIILHEYPISIVEHVGFREFCNAIQPLFSVVSRKTVKNDILKLYDHEKLKTMKLLSKNQSRIAITTDMWTSSNQKRDYMAIKAHYIDDSWTLQSRILRFIYMPAPQSVDSLSDVLVQCLMDWNLDRKLSTLTVGNCSTNDAIFDRILNKISPGSFILGGQLFRMRCCNHILNLIVKDGLSIISVASEKVRESVYFWKATPEREEKFKETCDQLNIPYNKKLVLDCKTRWISTFLMLDAAIPYREVFYRLTQEEPQYISLPCEDDWNMAKEICQRLELFYGVAELFSGTTCPTSNVYFPKVCEIRLTMREWLSCPNVIIQQMASSMIAKFDNYWGEINEVMAVGAVLDPRYKMQLLNYFFPHIYGEHAHHEIEKVKTVCQDLFTEYKNKSKENETSSSSARATVTATSSARRKDNWRSNFAMFVSQQSAYMNIKSELDHYLDEQVLRINLDEEFDILTWWKINGLKYPTLQRIARDFLAIPISTVASESTFSTSGRFLTPLRSKLYPDTVEALMCAQDWLWTDMQGSSKVDFKHCTTQEDRDDESSSMESFFIN